MNRLPESVNEWIEYYDKQYRRAYENFQETGESRYETAYIKADEAANAFRVKAELRNEVDTAKMRRIRNANALIDKLPHGKDFSREEVAEYISEVARW